MLLCWHSGSNIPSSLLRLCLCSLTMCHTPEQNNKLHLMEPKSPHLFRGPNSSLLDLVESVTSWMNSLVKAQHLLCGASHICVIASLNNVPRLQRLNNQNKDKLGKFLLRFSESASLKLCRPSPVVFSHFVKRGDTCLSRLIEQVNKHFA